MKREESLTARNLKIDVGNLKCSDGSNVLLKVMFLLQEIAILPPFATIKFIYLADKTMTKISLTTFIG